MNDLGDVFAGIAAIVVIAVLIIVIMTFPTMLLWNWIAAGIFGLPTLTFWQTFGLMFLCNLLFKNTEIKKSE